MQEEKVIDSLEHIRNKVFSNKGLLEPEMLNDTFDKMDEEMWTCISTILESPCRFVEDRLAEVAVRSIGNMTYGRVLFNKDSHTVDSWVLLCGTLLHLAGEEKDENNIKKVKKLLLHMAWVRAIYEEILDEFINKTKNYAKLCDEEDKALSKPTALLGSNIHRLRVRKQIVEDAIGLDRDGILGVLATITAHRDNYFELRNTIITPFLRLVFAEASKISGPAKSVLTVDIFQAGVFGLIRAISTFFKERQAYFSAYARWWVRQSILLSLKEEVSFFKIPSAVWHVYNKLERGEKIEEDSEKIRQYVDVIKLVPLEQPIQHEGNTARLLDTLVDVDQEDQGRERELSHAIQKMLVNIDPLASKYICLKFGVLSHFIEQNVSKETIVREQIRQTIALLHFRK